jgi:hypothetical protein
MSMTDAAEILRSNRGDMRKHLELQFARANDYDDGLIEIAVNTGRGWLGQLFTIDAIDEAVDYAASKNEAGCNTYVGVALRDPDTAPFGRASDADHYATTVVGGDLDTAAASAAAIERTRHLPPTYVVCTGQHPHVRLQPFWRLDEPITDQEQHRQLFAGIADMLDGDRAVINPGRIMRLAGSIAWPTKEGRVPELTKLLPVKDEARAYSAEAIARAYPNQSRVTAFDPAHKNEPIERVGAKNGLGLDTGVIDDGREKYMRDTILAVMIQWIGETGAAPTDQELFDAAWPQYSAKVDLSRPGRGQEEMVRKIRSTLRRFDRGQLKGLPDMDAAASRYKAKQKLERTMPAAVEPKTHKGQLFLRAKFFAANWQPAEYLVDGILQRGYCYSLTSPTGHGKTSVILNLAASIGTGRNFAGAETLKGRVGYFAAENPNDIQARWIGMMEAMGFDDADVWFCPFTIDLSTSFDQIKSEVEAAGGFDLIVVDTSQAFFGGEDENSNTQMVTHAKAMRKLTQLPGNPCVIILTHPVKNPSKDNLLPRGGGGFLAEVDGNLTIWNDSDNIVLHHQGKFRGAGFAPVNFVLKPVQPKLLKDAKGRQIPTVVSEHVNEDVYRKRLAENATDEDKVMILILSRKGDISFADIATLNNWVSPLGAPQKSKVARLVDNLKKQKLVTVKRNGKLALTKAGKAEIGPKARALGVDAAGEDDAENDADEADFG